MIELNHIRKRKELDDMGWDFFPRKQENGKYRIEVWQGNDKCHGTGNFEYDKWMDGIVKTVDDFHKKFINK